MKDDEDQQFVIIQFNKCRQRKGFKNWRQGHTIWVEILNTYKLGSTQILSIEKTNVY